ncbi:MAG: hypothetical protein JRJ79_08460 [Deltaproteobacteria bacterium]|nr:hypothetical protein [Deltaproteobacteria bacterium]
MPKHRLQPKQYLMAIQFSERLADTRLWIQSAQDLEDAAAILESDIRRYWREVKVVDGKVQQALQRKSVQRQYLMLMAYALENYFKAILIHRNMDSPRNRVLSDLPSYIKSHDLVDLALKSDIQLNTDEEELLSRLLRFSTWAARYPVPTGPDSLAAAKELSDGKTYLMAYYSQDDLNRVVLFADRLRKTALKITGST